MRPPPVEQRDVVHIPAQDVELVRADQHARSGVGALAQPTHQTLLGERVETDEGLVQDVDVRRVGEGAGDHEALLLAAGQLLGAPRRLVAQLDGRQSIGRRRPGLPAAETAEPGSEQHVVLNVQEPVDDELLRAPPDSDAGGALHGARADRQEAEQAVHQRRLAGTVPAEQPTNPAAFHRQIDAPENGVRTARIGDRQGFHRHIVGLVGHNRVLLNRNMNGSIVRRNICTRLVRERAVGRLGPLQGRRGRVTGVQDATQASDAPLEPGHRAAPSPRPGRPMEAQRPNGGAAPQLRARAPPSRCLRQ